MDVEARSRNVRLEQMCLVLRPTGTSRRELIAQLCTTDHDITTKPHEQASRQLFLQLLAGPKRDHHGRDIHLAAGCPHRDRWPSLAVHHNHRHRASVHCALNFIDKKTDTAIDHHDVTLDCIGVFQIFAGPRRIGVNHLANDLSSNLKFLRE